MTAPLSTQLADYTTFHIGGPAKHLVVVKTESELIEAVSCHDGLAQDKDGASLILSGGSNMLIADQGFPGTVVKIATQSITVNRTQTGIRLSVAAGESWDDLVRTSVEQGFRGLEMLSGIPGLAGASPIQNIGAYGAQVADSIHQVRAYDRKIEAVVTLPGNQCSFGYRTSMFKQSSNRYIVISIDLDLETNPLSQPVQYTELANHLGVGIGTSVPITEVREAVLSLRRSKGMVYDPADHDTWSAGSFFTNPIIDKTTHLPENAPRYHQPDGTIKTSAAWLIEQTGFKKGYGDSRARLSTKHVLALTNYSGATAEDILALARTIRDGVYQTHQITLIPEPTLVGLSL